MPIPDRKIYIGLFLLSLAVLVFELTLTRIFSVTLYYHLAFFIISVIMLGISLGAMLVYCYPARFPEGNENQLLGKYSLYFALSAPAAMLIHALAPLNPQWPIPVITVFILITCLLVCAAHIYAGISICLALTRYPEKSDRLYAADLAGASVGCLVFAFTLGPFDGISETILAGAIAAVAAALFAGSEKKLRTFCTALAVMLFAGSALNAYLVNEKNAGLRIVWTRGNYVGNAIYERWSPLARITVTGSADKADYNSAGFSTVGPKAPVKVLDIDLDGAARTSMIGQEQGSTDPSFLKYDLSYIGHYIRPDADVLIIGAGGGRDLLAALAFNQKSVRGLELNPTIYKLVTNLYADFGGHLATRPKVTIVNDEARSYITRNQNKYDIIQMSLIDTWAATANGAYVLTENCLYTTDAWHQFLSRLTPRGFFSLTRWYVGEPPLEAIRSLSLASKSLREMGVEHPENNIIAVRNESPGHVPVVTFLVAIEPFSKEDVQTILDQCKKLKFDCILAPGQPSQPNLEAVVKGDMSAWAGSPYNLNAPSDDSPFFFNMVKLERVLGLKGKDLDNNSQAVLIVLDALLISLMGAFMLAWLPLRIVKTTVSPKLSLSLAGYFLGIGLGFMFVEISQIQRYIVFLGHPTFGVTCVLLTLLLATGTGSLSSSYLPKTNKASLIMLILLVVSLVASAALSPAICATFRYQPTVNRIIIACLALALPGLCMGFGFPLGLRLCKEKAPNLSTWLWGLNGAGSVIGSVLALCISIGFGISALTWVAALTYAVSLICFVLAQRAPKEPTG